ncbi:MAG: hypothetical protein PVG65_00040 [Candidatus Thorarchaeota archaeon]|jgi:hypothetical protein
MGKKFQSVQELKKEIKSKDTWWDKFILNPKMNWLRWLIYNLPDTPKDISREIKWFIQRGRRGWSDRDSWSIDWWLAEIMPSILKALKKSKQGTPFSCFSNPQKTHHSKYEMKVADRRWNKILDNIIYTFETANNILDNHWIYSSTKDYYTKNAKEYRKCMSHLEFIYIMSYQECKRFEKGQQLFWKHFFSLWD